MTDVISAPSFVVASDNSGRPLYLSGLKWTYRDRAQVFDTRQAAQDAVDKRAKCMWLSHQSPCIVPAAASIPTSSHRQDVLATRAWAATKPSSHIAAALSAMTDCAPGTLPLRCASLAGVLRARLALRIAVQSALEAAVDAGVAA